MGGSALRRAESSACGNGGTAGAMAMVKCCRPQRLREARPNLGDGALEKTLGRGRVALLSHARGVGDGLGCPATLYAHGSTIGKSEVRGRVGNFDAASARPEEKRPPEQSCPRPAPAQPHLSCIIPNKMGFVPSVPVFPVPVFPVFRSLSVRSLSFRPTTVATHN